MMMPEFVTRKKTVRFIAIMVIFAAMIVLALIISMNTGFIRLSPLEVKQTFFGGGTAKQQLILFEFRLPRIVLSLLIGAGLATAGAILQGISCNALADPGILGINAGAGLMVIVYISFFPAKESASVALMPFLALVGAAATATIIFLLAYKKGQGTSPVRLILVGIAIAAAISAATVVLSLRLNPQNYQFVAIWLAGSIWGSNWTFVLSLLPWIVVLIPLTIMKARVLNILNLGDQLATGLGTSIAREQIWLIAAAVGLAGSCVAAGGGIGFVGLIAPHIARRLIGPAHQFLLPISALAGALLLLVADTLGRTIMQPTEIPTGIVVAVIGAPYFLYLLAKSKA
ncbi:UNVERIFIED_CONTAM: iron complex transport system permease protein [Brevibacillus sp. OAP136]